MVQAMINIAEKPNRVLNIVKAKYGLKDKSQAIEFIVNNYEDNFLEPALRPEYFVTAPIRFLASESTCPCPGISR